MRIQRSEQGFSNRATIISVTPLRNGANVSSPVCSPTSNLELDHGLDGHGEFVEITGCDQLPAAATAKLPESLARSLTGLLDYQSIQQADEEAYRRIYSASKGSSLGTGVAIASADTTQSTFWGAKLMKQKS